MRGVRGVFVFFAFLATVVTGCDRGFGRDTAAIAADFRLGVEDAAQILAPVSALPNDGGVVETTLDFWIDYTLLAWVVNQEGALEELDISSIVDQEVERVIVVRLRDQVIQLDTAITDEELQATFEERRPGEEVRARHILLSITPGAAQAERDSVRALAEDIRDRARAGEDFATLAEEYSQDPGSAIQGGDLGFFGRGMMVPPFEEAAFALPLGEVSDVVQSGFGFHVILLEERRTPSLRTSRTRTGWSSRQSGQWWPNRPIWLSSKVPPTCDSAMTRSSSSDGLRPRLRIACPEVRHPTHSQSGKEGSFQQRSTAISWSASLGKSASKSRWRGTSSWNPCCAI